MFSMGIGRVLILFVWKVVVWPRWMNIAVFSESFKVREVYFKFCLLPPSWLIQNKNFNGIERRKELKQLQLTCHQFFKYGEHRVQISLISELQAHLRNKMNLDVLQISKPNISKNSMKMSSLFCSYFILEITNILRMDKFVNFRTWWWNFESLTFAKRSPSLCNDEASVRWYSRQHDSWIPAKKVILLGSSSP